MSRVVPDGWHRGCCQVAKTVDVDSRKWQLWKLCCGRNPGDVAPCAKGGIARRTMLVCEPAPRRDPGEFCPIRLIVCANYCMGGVPIGADRDPAPDANLQNSSIS